MPKYDGTIRFDTKIDSKGFNEGVKKLSSSVGAATKAVVTSLLKIVAAAAVAVIAVVAIGAAIIGITHLAIKFISKIIDKMYSATNSTSAFYSTISQLKAGFDSVKGAVTALGASILTALAPVILKVIAWLVKAINWVSMLIASLSGQKTVLQYLSGTVEAAAQSSGKWAKNVKEANKAADGALAAFDELNVLQQETAEEVSATGPAAVGVGGATIMQEVAVPAKFAATEWQKFKDKVQEIWKSFKDWFNEHVIYPVADWILNKLILPTVDWFIRAWEWIKETWTKVADWFLMKVVLPVVLFFKNLGTNIGEFFSAAWNWIKTIWNSAANWFNSRVIIPLTNWFRASWDNIKLFFSNAWNGIKNIWFSAAEWFRIHITEPIGRAFETVIYTIKWHWENTFAGIRDFVKGIINGIISFLNGLIMGVNTAINAVIGAINSLPKIELPSWLGGGTIGWDIPTRIPHLIPELATGAVIPPNSRFAAILGDQTSGKNIEAPEGLIRQIIQEEIGSIRSEVEIKFGGSLGALIRELKPYIDKENIRIGDSLVKGSIG